MAGALTAMVASIFSGGVTADPFFEYTTLLLPGNGTNGAQNNTFLDGSTNNFTITRNGNATQGSFSPFSQTGWGGAFNTSTTYLTVTDTSNLRFGSSNFTIEAFVYRAVSGATQTIASKGASTPTGWVFQISSADKLVFTDTSTSITGATSLAANTWYYVSVVRAGTGSNQTTLYVNAVSDATGTSATTFSQTNNMLIGADRSTANFANGYISNLRLSNTNRTISSAPTSALTADANTIFLGLYNNRFQYTDSTAAFTNMSVTGTPSVQAFSPFNPTSSWSAATNGGSGYFDGSGDYLSAVSNSVFNCGTGNWTIEAWVYIRSEAVAYPVILGNNNPTYATAGSLVFGNYNSDNPVYNNKFIITGYDGGLRFADATTHPLNTWIHIAVVRDSLTSLKMFRNGNLVASKTDLLSTYTFDWGKNGLLVGGGNWDGAQSYFNGYMQGLRLVKGTAVYTGAFTPPTAPITNAGSTSAASYPSTTNVNTSFASSECSLLLNFTNAGIYDATSKNNLETVGNAQISTTQSKWGGSSMAFDGTTDYLICYDSPVLEFGVANFTLELWVNTTSSSQYDSLISRDPSLTAGSWTLLMNSASSTSGDVAFWAYDYNSYSAAMVITTGASIRDGNWHHVALVRNGSSWVIYIDGASRGAQTSSITIGNSTANLWIANNQGNAGRDFSGYMQDVRLTIGIARYTANFTPPTAAFPTL